MKIMIVLVVLLSAAAFSQTAKVVQLDAADAKKAAALNAEKQRIEREIEELRAAILQKYLSVPADGSGHGGCLIGDKRWIVEGWNCGNFEFSDDFRFIVPARPQPSQSTDYWPLTIKPANCSGNVCW